MLWSNPTIHNNQIKIKTKNISFRLGPNTDNRFSSSKGGIQGGNNRGYEAQYQVDQIPVRGGLGLIQRVCKPTLLAGTYTRVVPSIPDERE